MSSTTQVHRNFVAEPMGDKSVRELAGIGDALGDQLEKAGFDKAYVVLGQYLVLKKDEKLFQEWLRARCDADTRHARQCYQCLRDWCEEFL